MSERGFPGWVNLRSVLGLLGLMLELTIDVMDIGTVQHLIGMNSHRK